MHRSSAASVTVFLAAILGLANPCRAQEADQVERALQTLDRALVNEQNLSGSTRDALRGVVQALRQERSISGAYNAEIEDKIDKLVADYEIADDFVGRKAAFQSAFPHLTFSGDFRFRFEANFNQDGATDRYRQRVRFRLGIDFALNDELTLRTRVRTGDPDDPNSPHQTLGGLFDSWALNFDRIYLQYDPEWAPGFRATIGKFGHAFRTNPIYGEIVWDADVQPEGLGLEWTRNFGDGGLERIELRAGLYDVLEQGGGDDIFAWTVQAAALFGISEDLDLQLVASYYSWGDITPDGNTGILADNQGNALVDRDGDGMADDFASDFGIIEVIAAATWHGLGTPVTIAGEYYHNHRAVGDQDSGWSIGLSVGNARSEGDWRFYYAFQNTEQDAIFSPVAEDDFLLATNSENHVFGVNYMIADNIGLHFWTLVSMRDELGSTPTTNDDDPQFRIRIDLNISF